MDGDEGEGYAIQLTSSLLKIGLLRKMKKNLDFSKLVCQRRLTVLSFRCLLPFQVVFPGLNISFVTNLLILSTKEFWLIGKGQYGSTPCRPCSVCFILIHAQYSLLSFQK
jgi:hypothetical protein